MPGINMQIFLKSEYDDTPLTKTYITNQNCVFHQTKALTIANKLHTNTAVIAKSALKPDQASK